MTLFDYVHAHPVLALLYLVIVGACLAAFRPVTVRTKTVHNIAAPAPEVKRVEEGCEEETESADAPAVDVSADPTGEIATTAAIRNVLATGNRVADVPTDLAAPIAATFRGEAWRVRVEPIPPGPFAGLASIGPNRARLTFVWGGEGASS